MHRGKVRILIFVAAVFLALAFIGAAYQRYGVSQDRKNYQPVGKLYDIQGKKMHLYSDGRGDTTVVFASGWGTANPYADFYPLYSALRKHVKIVVYDRFGYGYSDLTDQQRDIDSITNEIHELLQVSGQKPPYVFVGHSLGSLETIRYAQRYPDEVKGILLIEGGSPEYYESSPELVIASWINKGVRVTGVLRSLYHAKGFEEWMANESNGDKLLPENLKDLKRKAVMLLAGNRNMTEEIQQSQENARVVLAGDKPLSIPMTILTADYFGKLDNDKAWKESQAKLTSWSISGKQIIVKDSSHYIHSYQPERVIHEILQSAEAK